MSKIAINIRFLRQQRGISQEKLASDLGMNRGNIASYEGGKALPGAERLLKLAEYFGVEVPDMINRDLSAGGETDLTSGAVADPVTLESVAEQVRRLETMAGGFTEYHRHKLARSGEIPESLKYLTEDYDRLLELLQESIQNTYSLLNYVERNIAKNQIGPEKPVGKRGRSSRKPETKA